MLLTKTIFEKTVLLQLEKLKQLLYLYRLTLNEWLQSMKYKLL